MEHSQLFNLILAFIVAAASSWGGAKYAIKYLEKTNDKLSKSIDNIRCEMSKFATVEQCRDSKINCRADKSSSVKDIMAKIDQLAKDVLDQNRRREDAKDETQKIYLEITTKLARLEAKIESLMEARE